MLQKVAFISYSIKRIIAFEVTDLPLPDLPTKQIYSLGFIVKKIVDIAFRTADLDLKSAVSPSTVNKLSIINTSSLGQTLFRI